MINIARLKELSDKATEGPWAWEQEDESCVDLLGPKGLYDHVLRSSVCKSCQSNKLECASPNADNRILITESRNNIDAMLDWMERAKTLLETVKAMGLVHEEWEGDAEQAAKLLGELK